MSERQYREKEEEKRGEKYEKEEEKQEKSWDEKWRRDPLGTLVWAAILIWAGLVLLASNLGLLARFEKVEVWDLIFLGAGLIILLEVAIRLLLPDYRRPVIGSIILAIVFLSIGLGNLVNWGIIWALALIVIGALIIFRGVFRRRGE
jgi:hypothetical protein